MRLTLRTMLCYLDEVLEPADAAELGRKIEESEYASNLVHRIRTSMRKVRLAAPKLLGSNEHDEPNVVADYLDNTLPADQVADFERGCLESDNQLSEAASCHQILTLVLGEPAEVPPTMRERMYRLGNPEAESLVTKTDDGKAHRIEGAHATAAASGAAAAESKLANEPPVQATVEPPVEQPPVASSAAEQSALKRREKPEIPEYLKADRRRRVWPLALAALLLLVVVGGVMAALVTPWLGGTTPVAVNTLPQVAGNTPATSPPASVAETPANALLPPPGEAQGERPVGTNVVPPSVVMPAKEAPKVDEVVIAESGENDAAGNESGENGRVIQPPVGGAPVLTPEELAARDVKPAMTPAERSVFGLGGASSDVLPTRIARAGDGPVIPETGVLPGDPGPTEGPVAPAPVADKALAHAISPEQVVAAFDADSEDWFRLAPRAPLLPGARLRSLPTFRPQILLKNGVQITLIGATEMDLEEPLADGTPVVSIPFGRAVIATVGKAGEKVKLKLGDRVGVATLLNADSAFAVDVLRFHLPGSDPLAELPHTEEIILATGGKIGWEAQGVTPPELDVGHMLYMLDDNPAKPSAVSELPKWISSNEVSDIDRRASATLEPLLTTDRPLGLTLEELAEDHRVEVRSLAVRSLAALDYFDRSFDAFNNEMLKSYWLEHFDSLQQALARSPQSAARVLKAAQRRRGEDAPRIVRLLCGFSPADLANGADAQLVEYLKHPSLDYRVLAINNLLRITGRTYFYTAHVPEVRRRSATQEWSRRLDNKEIVYAKAPPELPKRTAPAASP